MDRSLDPPQPLVWINGWPAVGKQTVAQCLTQILGNDRAVLIDDRALTDQLDLPQGVPPPGCSRARGSSVSVGTAVYSGSNARSQPAPAPTDPANPTDKTDPADPADPAAHAAALAACFRTYVEDPAGRHRLVLFTDCCADDAPGAAAAQRYADAATRAGRPFVPVYVECGVSENERRTQMSERRCGDGHDCRSGDGQQGQQGQQASCGGTRMAGGPDGAPDAPSTGRTICTLAEARELRARTDGRLFTFPPDVWPGLFVDVTTQGVHETAMEILAFVNTVVEQGGARVAAAAAAAAARRPALST